MAKRSRLGSYFLIKVPYVYVYFCVQFSFQTFAVMRDETSKFCNFRSILVLAVTISLMDRPKY